MKINKLKAVDEFNNSFLNRSEIEKIRHAIILGLKNSKKINEKNCKSGIKVLKKWFTEKLYSCGRIPEDLKTMIQEFDFGFKEGLSFSVEKAIKNGNFSFGRFLNHLLMILEDREREIEYLKQKIEHKKTELIDYENALIDTMNLDSIPKEIRDNLRDKFYWLNGDY